MTKKVSIMPCLDMQNGRVVKGVHFVDIKDAGDPVECAIAYCRAGADELALLDITATVEGRATMLDVVSRVAQASTVPFTVGGGIVDVKSAAAVLEALKKELGVTPGNITEDGLFSLRLTPCVGACALAPVVAIGDDVYSKLTPDTIPEVVAKYRQSEAVAV